MANYAVVGGTSGIGRRVVEVLLSHNHQVWVTGRKPKGVDQITGVHYSSWSVSEAASFDLPEVLDGLIYAPGTIQLKPFHRISLDQFQEEMEVNLWGAVRAVQHVLPALKKSDHPSVVLFSTVAVQQGMPFHASIAAAKGAIEGLTRSLAAEYAPKIRFNAVAPSLVNTPLASRLLSSPEKVDSSASRHPLKRVGEPDDIASMAVFLLSNQAGWITGQIMGVDGGMSSVRSI